MEHLYAPWRREYVTGERIDGCVFCHISKNSNLDDKHQVLFRDKDCFIVTNKYPYTPAHFMIIPHKHTDAIEDLDEKVWLKMTKYARISVKMLKENFSAKGVNIGMNLGEVAGAGIAEHVHLHIVPRWSRDTNFITTISNARVYSTDFEEIYKKLKKLIPKYIDE